MKVKTESDEKVVLVHADGGKCHGTPLVDGKCPSCGIAPDTQSIEARPAWIYRPSPAVEPKCAECGYDLNDHRDPGLDPNVCADYRPPATTEPAESENCASCGHDKRLHGVDNVNSCCVNGIDVGFGKLEGDGIPCPCMCYHPPTAPPTSEPDASVEERAKALEDAVRAECPNCGASTNTATDAFLFLHTAVHASPWSAYHGLNKLPFALMPSVAEVMEQYAAKRLESERAEIERKAVEKFTEGKKCPWCEQPWNGKVKG